MRRVVADDKMSIWIAGSRVSLRVLLPVGIVIPNAKRLRQVLCFDRSEEFVRLMFCGQIPA